MTNFLEEFRNEGLESAKTDAREIAEKLKMEMSWPEVLQRRTPGHFEYEQTQSTAEDFFKRQFFLPLGHIEGEIFTHGTFYEWYGFLFPTGAMRNTEMEGRLDEYCQRLEQKRDDADPEDLKVEVKSAVRSFPTHNSSPFEMFDYIYKEYP